MRNQLSIALVAVALAMTGCRDDSDVTRKDQQNYETVQEGNAAGVTSDLGTAGIPPAAPVTSTNVDTTSAFTLQTGTFQPADPRTIGGTLPMDAPSATPYPQATARPRTPAPPPRIATDTPPPAPEPTPSENPTPMTSAAPPPPPASDTATAEPAPEPAAEPAQEQEQEEPKKEEPKQDEPAPPPPPPPGQ